VNAASKTKFFAIAPETISGHVVASTPFFGSPQSFGDGFCAELHSRLGELTDCFIERSFYAERPKFIIPFRCWGGEPRESLKLSRNPVLSILLKFLRFLVLPTSLDNSPFLVSLD
jgi:hypothetical protein